MNHREIYQWLLAPARRAGTLTLLAEQGYQIALGCRKSAVIDGPKFPYIRLLIPPNALMAAHSSGAVWI